MNNYVACGWIENWGWSPNRERNSKFFWGRARWAPPQRNFENSYLKLCNLVYSWSENLSFTTRPSLLRSYLWLPVSAQFEPEQSSGLADSENGTLYVKQRLLAIRFSLRFVFRSQFVFRLQFVFKNRLLALLLIIIIITNRIIYQEL